MTDYPHVQAAFINAIREEGTKNEACDWLQKEWNKSCALSARVKELEARLKAFCPACRRSSSAECFNPDCAMI